ncbi:threonine-phosphate decarboxylase [Maritimibacter sp. HL-12]|jgi:cobalamin biosynthesis protein CobC|uniref:threonine-phosphate decarboxylase n=1 Tax=Maritimibacter sp. HL-12 TaxID=1162418 RepID=UPI000A0F08F5|nr:threonine-phosphate decarboxylase [Maritimibacter sp. HL-12]SMH41374.1 L-threonine O-3-phosphate decarboxylase [Maritimibacter sp. HL-12]
MTAPGGARDHGGGLDAAIALHGGTRENWIDLSTGINPRPYPVPEIPPTAFTALPDRVAAERLDAAARAFWMVPEGAAVLAAPGASSLIANIPRLAPAGRVRIVERTYNEHEAAFRAAGWEIVRAEPEHAHAEARVVVHPNNPTGNMWSGDGEPETRALTVIDESFCDVILGDTRVREWSLRPGVVILKSLGKFWGLAGVRLGFAIGDPALIARLGDMLGPWPVSGVALHVGRVALEDMDWANRARQILNVEVARMDALVQARGAEVIGGTTLFRLYEVDDAARWQDRLARGKVWSRVFPYAPNWLRLGLPPQGRWDQLEAALR